MGDDPTQPRMGVRPGDEEGERVREDRIHDRDAAQVVTGRPEVPVTRPDQGGHVRGAREGVQKDLVPEVRTGRVDAQVELGGELIVEDRPFAAGRDARHPDPVPAQLCRREPRCGGQGMSRADEELQRGVERVDHPYVLRQCVRPGDRTERGVDIARRDGGGRHTRVVDPEGHHVQVGSRARPPVRVQHDGLRAAQAEHVDPQGPRAPPDRADRALDPRDDAARVREERPAVERQLDSPGGAGEQADPQLSLQGGDPLGDRLLRHPQLIGRMAEPSELGGPDERSQCFGVHRLTLGVHNRWLWPAGRGLWPRPTPGTYGHAAGLLRWGRRRRPGPARPH